MQWLSVIAVSVVLATAGHADEPKPVAERFKPLITDKPTAAIVVSVYHDGQASFISLGEVTTPVGTAAPDEHTLFEIGSITKTFTGVLLAEAIRRGEVALDDPANQHLPERWQLKPKTDKPVSLQHLVTHQSGLPVEPPLIGLLAKNSANPYADFTEARLTKLLAQLTPTNEPDAKYAYSNLGYGLLGHALVHAAKARSYEQLLCERIAGPLKMRDTGAALDGNQKARLAMPHTEKGKSTDPWDFATLEACGAIRSSASDMLRYAAANLGECDASLRDVLTTSHTKLASAENENVAIAYGWHRFEHKDKPPVVWHNGGTGGYRCMLVLQPEKKIAVVALSVGVVGKDLDRATLEHLQQLLRDEEAKPPNR